MMMRKPTLDKERIQFSQWKGGLFKWVVLQYDSEIEIVEIMCAMGGTAHIILIENLLPLAKRRVSKLFIGCPQYV